MIKTLTVTWLFRFGLAPAPTSPHLSHSAFCCSQILTSLEEQVALANKHMPIGPLQNPKTAYEQKDIRNTKGELHKGNKISFPQAVSEKCKYFLSKSIQCSHEMPS